MYIHLNQFILYMENIHDLSHFLRKIYIFAGQADIKQFIKYDSYIHYKIKNSIEFIHHLSIPKKKK